LNGNPKDV